MSNPNNPQSISTEALLNHDKAPASKDVSPAEFELGSINLISQLEIQIDSAKSRSNHVANASENTDRLLSVLLAFCDEFLAGEHFAQASQSIEKASFASLAHNEVLSTRSWGFALKSLFGSDVCNDESVRQTYDQLGEALLKACVAVLTQAVATVGSDSPTGKTIEQSTAIFVEEFKANW